MFQPLLSRPSVEFSNVIKFSPRVLVFPSLLATLLCGLLWPREWNQSSVASAVAAATPAPRPLHLLPPQAIKVDPDVKQIAAPDLNGDGYSDIVTANWSNNEIKIDGATFPKRNLSVTVLVNEGKPTTLSQTPKFIPQRIELVTEKMLDDIRSAKGIRPDAPDEWINETTIGHIELADMDGDGFKDLLVASTPINCVMVVWNRYGRGAKTGPVFEYVPGNTDLKKTSTLYNPLSERWMVISAKAGDFNGDGKTDIAAYCANLNRKANTQSEFLWMIPGVGAGGFDPVGQIKAWKGEPLELGYGPGKLGLFPGQEHLFDHTLSVIGATFYDAPADVVRGADGKVVPDMASHLMSGPGVMKAVRQSDGRDMLLFDGKGRLYGLEYNELMYSFMCTDWVDNVDGRGAGSDVIELSNEARAVVIRGGKEWRYGHLGDETQVVSSADRDYFKHPNQMGAFVKVVEFNGRKLLLSSSDHDRPGEAYHYQSFDYKGAAQGKTWGNDGLLLVEELQEVSAGAGNVRFKPALEGVDRDYFQALPLKGWVQQKIGVEVGCFGNPGEDALAVLNNDEILIYREDDGGYVAPAMRIDRVDTAWSFLAGLVNEADNIVFQGEVGVIKGTFSTDDPPRYATIRKAGKEVAVIPIGKPVMIAGQQTIPLLGTNTLQEGDDYEIEIWNSNKSVRKSLRVVKPFDALNTNRDSRAYQPCAIESSTLTGKVYPSSFSLGMSSLFKADKLEKIRLRRISDGSVVNITVGAGGARVEGGKVIVPIPGDIAAGNWQMLVSSDGYWRLVPGIWPVTRDTALCSSLVKPVNEQTPAQTDRSSLYLEKLTMPDGKAFSSGDVKFIGGDFGKWGIKSVALTGAGGKVIWDDAPVIQNEGKWLRVNWGELTGQLDEGLASVKFYRANRAEVEAEGVPPTGELLNWRTVKNGKAPLSGDVSIKWDASKIYWGEKIKLRGKGVAFPGAETITPVMRLSDGRGFVFPSSFLSYPNEWLEKEQTNTEAVLELQLPKESDIGLYRTSGIVREGPREGDRSPESALGGLNGGAPAIPLPAIPAIPAGAVIAAELGVAVPYIGAVVAGVVLYKLIVDDPYPIPLSRDIPRAIPIAGAKRAWLITGIAPGIRFYDQWHVVVELPANLESNLIYTAILNILDAIGIYLIQPAEFFKPTFPATRGEIVVVTSVREVPYSPGGGWNWTFDAIKANVAWGPSSATNLASKDMYFDAAPTALSVNEQATMRLLISGQSENLLAQLGIYRRSNIKCSIFQPSVPVFASTVCYSPASP